ncbi:DMT family transporter [Thioalbus denitrificans]|uniref:EamA-like transporter family protein n=1 Tax=Thioalbus denitrificans TaxID=547122 RepID=A0A369CBW8_9GAMM|nr:DMT family transporter [Thioalbus denitrificans]RCX30708.1 EamA-like transporter family protein [Thioalbus denitrificans]
MNHRDIQRGALLLVGAALAFASMGAVIKISTGQLHYTQVVFFRSLFGLLAMTPWMLRHGVRGLATPHLRLHLGRSLSGVAAMFCFFYAIAELRLGEAVLLNYTAPLFTPLIAWFWLREPVTRGIYIAIAAGFTGILLILKPGFGVFQPAALAGLASGVLAALAFVGIRRMAGIEPPTRIVFYYSLLSTAVAALPLAWYWRAPEPREWLLLMGVGGLATIGQLLLTRAYSLAPVGRIGPFTYTAVVFAALYGRMLWDETLGPVTLAGMVLVCLAGILALRRKAVA